MKKVISLLFAILTVFGCLTPVFGADVSKIDDYKAMFVPGDGPETDGVKVDYVTFSPKVKSGKKYPLVIYFHGMGQGKEPGAQIEDNNISLWASDELQSRFNNGGAFLFVPRTHEESNEYWDDKYIISVKAAIDSFISQNKKSIDLTRIYVGGFSMGGKMTLKMITSYPGMFAAAFPMCPAYVPTENQFRAIENMPIWLSTSKYDIIAGYHSTGKRAWEGLCEYTNVPEKCRFTLFGKVVYPDGTKTPSNHHIWFAVSNDMFTYDGKTYPNTVTTDANGTKVYFKYPYGIISWLNKYTSEYDGSNAGYTGLASENSDSTLGLAWGILRSIPLAIIDTAKAVFGNIKNSF